MARSLLVRNVDDEIVRRLELRAARHGRSVEAEHREILRHVLGAGERGFWERARELRARTEGRSQTPAEDLIRDDRDRRAGLIG